MRTHRLLSIGILPLVLSACGFSLGNRHFFGPIVPVPEAQQKTTVMVSDDRSVTYSKDRLEVTLQPLTADMLNRNFAGQSESPEGFHKANPYAGSVNPFTYGDWVPSGEKRAPERFTVFLLKVKNYAYPKVQLDPADIAIEVPNGRRYESLSLSAMIEYYWPYAVAYAGNTYQSFKAREGLLRRSLFTGTPVFSGQETEGYIVFPVLGRDVETFTVTIRNMSLRFDFRGEPIESVDIPYLFNREVYVARHPRTGET